MTPEDAPRDGPVALARRLIARRQYDEAIGLMRSQMRERAPTALMRLRFADVLSEAGRGGEAVPLFLALADEFAAEGYVARAVAVLKRVDALAPGREDVGRRLSELARRQHLLAASAAAHAHGLPPPADPEPSPGFGSRVRGVFRRFLASLSGGGREALPEGEAAAPGEPGSAEAAFEERVLDVVREAARVVHAAPRPAASVDERMRALDRAARLVATPLFAELSEEELLAVVRGLQLLVFEPGQIVITEGQSGQSLFVITSGTVKVFVRNPAGHDVEVGELREGDFFGEISSLSGRPRTATVTAAERCELLELDKATVEAIARTHARVREMLDAAYVERLSSPEAAAARQVAWSEGTTRSRALDVLQENFGEAQWTPRTRLRLADALFKAGRQEEVIAVLLDCVDELTREGFPEKAVALLKKIERIQRRDVEQLNLAPLLKAAEGRGTVTAPGAPAIAASGASMRIEEHFDDWLLELARQAAARRKPEPRAAPARPENPPGALAGYLGGLRASPLLESLSDAELTAVVRAFVLVRCAPGHIILSEGEPGQSVFVLANGSVRVHVRDAESRNVEVARLGEGAFFGEMSALSSRARSATVTAAAPCELLELDRDAIDRLCASHPRVRATLEEFSVERTASLDGAAARGTPPPGDPEA
jgi:CRP-like cAMP-binding protein